MPSPRHRRILLSWRDAVSCHCPNDDEKLFRDSLPRVDEKGFERHQEKALTVSEKVRCTFSSLLKTESPIEFSLRCSSLRKSTAISPCLHKEKDMSKVIEVSEEEYEQFKSDYPECLNLKGRYYTASSEVIKVIYNKDDPRRKGSNDSAMWYEWCLRLIREKDGRIVWEEGWRTICCAG